MSVYSQGSDQSQSFDGSGTGRIDDAPHESEIIPSQILGAISWFLLVAVMFGGESLILMLTSREGMSAHEEQFFRAGHGHAGVLAGIGILYSGYLGRTFLGARAQYIAWSAYALGVFMISGGMFLHMMIGTPNERSNGILVTAIGGIVLAAAVIFLAWQLIRARRGGS